MLFVLSSVPKGIPVRWLRAFEPVVVRRFHPHGPISIVFVSEREIRRLNLLYRGKDTATDVLSFRYAETDMPQSSVASEERACGEIVFCAKVLAQHAREHATTLADEFQALCIHATLHLMGYDHEAAGEAVTMEALERRLAAEYKKNLGKSAKFQYTKEVQHTVTKRKNRKSLK